jgi:hypothetical protein
VPYYFYTKERRSEPKNLIYVEEGFSRPQIKEISEVSAAVRGLQKGYQMHRVCFPAELKAEIAVGSFSGSCKVSKPQTKRMRKNFCSLQPNLASEISKIKSGDGKRNRRKSSREKSKKFPQKIQLTRKIFVRRCRSKESSPNIRGSHIFTT